jgi:hypothetical protein
MRLEAARDLKAELLHDLVVPFTIAAVPGAEVSSMRGDRALAAELAHCSPLAIGAAPMTTIPAMQRSVALGVSPKGRGYVLAVRVQRQALLDSPLIDHIRAQARGELDVRLIGRLEKRTRGREQLHGIQSVVGLDGEPGRRRRPEDDIATRPVATLVNDAAGLWHRGNTRPLLIGSSVGHVKVTAGTLGAFVTRDGRVHLLSNNHVLANEDRCRRGDAVLQRGSVDGGRAPDDEVGSLQHRVRLKPDRTNLVDAALALVRPEVGYEPLLLRGIGNGADGQLAGLGPEFVAPGTTVYKVGRTTGVTEGRVSAFEMDNLVVSFDIGNLRFDDQVEIEGAGNHAFSDGGDSGSLIVDQEMRAVALLFAGGDVGGTNGFGLTYANPIRSVLKATRSELLL